MVIANRTSLERPSYDPRLPVMIVAIDDESPERLGQWPWPRTLLAGLVDRLTAAGAAVIAFDVVFAEPDRSSPERVLPSWPATPEVQALAARHRDFLDAYRAGRWQVAGVLLAECRALAEARLEALYALYGERLEAYRENPPPADWDSVYVAKTK